MKPNPCTSEGIKAALKALYSPPMTDEERREFDRLVAREYARREAAAEARQLQLDVS